MSTCDRIEGFRMTLRCRHCGYPLGAHAGDTNPHGARRCPASPTFPKWPKSIRDEVRAGQVYDQRITKFWTARSTTFAAE